MKDKPFLPHSADAAGILTWAHVGDLHMTRAGEQNDYDLQAIVQKLDRDYSAGTSFVYLPGDHADDGSRAAYQLIRRSLDQLNLPWCAIIGDHDVHEKSFANYLEAMADHTRYAFTAGKVRFLAMNAFDIPDPASFTVSSEQLRWLEGELQQATAAGQPKVLLLHCYPSDLKHGGPELTGLIHDHSVNLVDMGHTHYNEIANDGRTLYTATRSTGQIEEGPVGFSVTNLDGDAWSWRFVELTAAATVIITNPADARLLTTPAPTAFDTLTVRAKVWSDTPVRSVEATLGSTTQHLSLLDGSQVWQGTLEVGHLNSGTRPLRVTAHIANGDTASDEIQFAFGPPPTYQRHTRDQDNQIGAWPEHSLLGTQLGPNKNGKKW